MPKEPENETRVGIVPSSMKKLLKAGFEVLVEKGADVNAKTSQNIYKIINMKLQEYILYM